MNTATYYQSAVAKPGKGLVMHMCVRNVGFVSFCEFFNWILELFDSMEIYALLFTVLLFIGLVYRGYPYHLVERN
jgi:hypothetical protein